MTKGFGFIDATTDFQEQDKINTPKKGKYSDKRELL